MTRRHEGRMVVEKILWTSESLISHWPALLDCVGHTARLGCGYNSEKETIVVMNTYPWTMC